MEEAAQKLKRIRERLGLTYRHVEEASARIANAHQNDEFLVALSRLSDIENKGTIPTLYRLYSLCAVYRLDIAEVMGWYGISVGDLPADATLVELPRTQLVGFQASEHAEVQIPLALDPGIDVSKTEFLSRMIQRWGKLPLVLLRNFEPRNHLYGLIGTDDWFMFPIIPPGSLVVIDPNRRRISTGGWNTELDRPIYFVEHRSGYSCCWCSQRDDRITLHPHPSSSYQPESYTYPQEIEVLGQVTQVAMTLEPGRRHLLRHENT